MPVGWFHPTFLTPHFLVATPAILHTNNMTYLLLNTVCMIHFPRKSVLKAKRDKCCYKIAHPPFFPDFFPPGKTTHLIASSKTFFSPFWVSAEHSRYIIAPISFAKAVPCSGVIGFCPFSAILSMVALSSRMSVFVPTRMIFAVGAWCFSSGIHLDLMFWNEVKPTTAARWDNERSAKKFKHNGSELSVKKEVSFHSFILCFFFETCFIVSLSKKRSNRSNMHNNLSTKH